MFGVFGDIILDITVHARGPLQVGSDVVGKISYQGGGSAANFATWLSAQGSKVRFLGAIGEDPVGQVCGLELKEYGVEPFLVKKSEPTGTILLFLDERGERTMVTSRGANLLLVEQDFTAEFFTGLNHMHFTAYSLFGSVDLAKTTYAVMVKAKEQQLSISLDPSSYALLREFGVEKFLELTKGVDLVIPNLDEGRTLTSKTSPEDIVKSLLNHYPTVVLTMGSQGCLCGTKYELVHVPTEELVVVDTTGAGDAFAAGFVHAYTQGQNLTKSAQLGHSLASVCVQHYGGRPRLDR